MEITSLGFRTDLALLAETGSEIEDRGTHLVIRTPQNPNFYWGNFILLAKSVVPGGEREVVGAFHAEFPDAGHVSIGIDGPQPPEDLQAWRDAGLAVEVSTVLTADRLVQPLAAWGEIEIRELTSDEDWEARTSLARLFDQETPQDAFGAYARGRNDAERRLVAAGRGQRFGAFVEGDLVSTAAIFMIGSGLARYQVVETHPEYRRRGLATSLVYAAGHHAWTTLGATQLVIVADPEGEAINLYRRLGFVDAEHQVQFEQRAQSAAAK